MITKAIDINTLDAKLSSKISREKSRDAVHQFAIRFTDNTIHLINTSNADSAKAIASAIHPSLEILSIDVIQ